MRLRLVVATEEVMGEEGKAVARLTLGPDMTGAEDGGDDMDQANRQKQTETVYTQAAEGVKEMRAKIAAASFALAKEHIVGCKRRRGDPAEAMKVEEETAALYNNAGRLRLNTSQIGDARPVASCCFSPDDQYVATCSWSGLAKLWSRETCESLRSFRGHTDRVTHCAINPRQGKNAPNAANFATASADCSAKLWSLGDAEDEKKKIATPLRSLEGHRDRLGQVAWHPSGDYIGTTSYDLTWRLWDVETGGQILLQDGHASEVYGMARAAAAAPSCLLACRLGPPPPPRPPRARRGVAWRGVAWRSVSGSARAAALSGSPQRRPFTRTRRWWRRGTWAAWGACGTCAQGAASTRCRGTCRASSTSTSPRTATPSQPARTTTPSASGTYAPGTALFRPVPPSRAPYPPSRRDSPAASSHDRGRPAARHAPLLWLALLWRLPLTPRCGPPPRWLAGSACIRCPPTRA